MNIDEHGHIVVAPKEVQKLAENNPKELINKFLIPGTPHAFSTYEEYNNFLEHISDGLQVHPQNIIVRGSAKLGFSLASEPDKIWKCFSEKSDLDLGIVDIDYFHFFERELRKYEREGPSRDDVRKANEFKEKTPKLRKTRGYYQYRYFDFPKLKCFDDQKSCLEQAPLNFKIKSIDAFLYRDWWSVFSKYENELHKLTKAIKSKKLEAGGDEALDRKI